MDYSKLYERLLGAHALLPYYTGRKKAWPPIRVQVELTGRCNLKCSFCYQGQAYKQGQGELSFEQVIKIINQTPRFSLLTFSGGEPLLKEKIAEILDYALRKHYCNMITNGVLLSPELSKLMVDKRFLLINVSLDGIGQVHDQLRGLAGTFGKVKENLLRLKEYKDKRKSRFPLVDVKTLVSKKNISQLVELYKFCQEIGAACLSISLPKNNDLQFNGTVLYEDLNNEVFYKHYSTNNNLDVRQLITALERLNKMRSGVRLRYYPRFEDYRLFKDYLEAKDSDSNLYYPYCTEPWSGFQINAQGQAYPCLAYRVGNIAEQGLREVWNSQRFIKFRARLRQLKLFPACSGCCYLKIRWKGKKGLF